MNPELAQVSDYMRDLGLGALTHALRLSFYYAPEWPAWPALSVLHAAHAAEILLKARIAQEHPLLIFDELPRSTQSETLLDFQLLFEKGKTLQFQDLPDRLWAATGIRLHNVEQYRKFGMLRNAIQHFAPPREVEPSDETLKFVFQVVDPFIHDNWGLFAIDFNEEHGDHYEHIFDSLVHRDIRPHISYSAATYWSKCGLTPDANAPKGYKNWYRKALHQALKVVT